MPVEYTPSRSSSSSSSSALPRSAVPSLALTNFPTKHCLSTSLTSSTSSNTSSHLLHTTAIPISRIDLVNAHIPASRSSDDPSAQDFDFDDLFTFTNQSNPAAAGSSLKPPPHLKAPKGAQHPSLMPQPQRLPQPQQRNWSIFSFSHYNVAPPSTSTTTPSVNPKSPRRHSQGVEAQGDQRRR
jgi:hypothetical protein